jgi:hypothetical protein
MYKLPLNQSILNNHCSEVLIYYEFIKSIHLLIHIPMNRKFFIVNGVVITDIKGYDFN